MLQSSPRASRAALVTLAAFCLLVTGSSPPALALHKPETLPAPPTTIQAWSYVLATPSRPRAKVRGRARVTKSAQYVAAFGSWQGAIDRCRGPVAYNSVYPGVPWILAEHVHCGGRWALSARAGTTLRINNGALAGRWRANGRSRTVGLGSSTMVTRGLGGLVVQTCIPGTRRVKLVGFDRA